jgi:hypothetical protein
MQLKKCSLIWVVPLTMILPICHTHKNKQNGLSMESPKKMEIHDVFHVRLLQKYVFDIIHWLLELLQTLHVGDTITKLEKILITRLQQFWNITWIIFLLKWKHYPMDEAMWENKSYFEANFLDILSLTG